MMLQTLVENAIKHGLGKQPGNCTIKISAHFVDDKQIITVVNNGKLQMVEQDGFGLQSTKERLQILYKEAATFEIFQDTDNLVTAKLMIPIQK
jgi:LytS/YehU family sensor histidine kinase